MLLHATELFERHIEAVLVRVRRKRVFLSPGLWVCFRDIGKLTNSQAVFAEGVAADFAQLLLHRAGELHQDEHVVRNRV